MGTEPSENERAAASPAASPAEPPVRAAVIAKHVALTLAICASTALLIDYRNAGDPAFCGVQSGCFAVKASAYSHIGAVPLPNLALPAFAIPMGASIFATTALHHRVVAAAAGVGALAAAALIAVQAFLVGAFCPWCIVVDSSAILAGIASIGLAIWIGPDDGRALQASVQGRAAGAWAIAGALAIGLPLFWARYPAIPTPPPEIQAQLQAGKVTMISYTDFECPFCRKLHPTIDALRDEHKDKLRFVRKMKPLAGHPGAMPAARAWVCSPEAKRDEIANVLYEMDTGDLKMDKLVTLADKYDLGGRDAFAACLSAKATDDAIQRDADEFVAIHGRGLPYTFVNGRQIVGLDPDRLTSAVAMEMGGPAPALPLSGMFALLGVMAVLAGAFTWTAKP